MIDVVVAPQLTIIFFPIVLMQKCRSSAKWVLLVIYSSATYLVIFYDQPKTFLMMKVLQTVWPKFIKET